MAHEYVFFGIKDLFLKIVQYGRSDTAVIAQGSLRNWMSINATKNR